MKLELYEFRHKTILKWKLLIDKALRKYKDLANGSYMF